MSFIWSTALITLILIFIAYVFSQDTIAETRSQLIIIFIKRLIAFFIWLTINAFMISGQLFFIENSGSLSLSTAFLPLTYTVALGTIFASIDLLSLALLIESTRALAVYKPK